MLVVADAMLLLCIDFIIFVGFVVCIDFVMLFYVGYVAVMLLLHHPGVKVKVKSKE